MQGHMCAAYGQRLRVRDMQVQAILEGVIELRNENVDLVEIQGTVEEVTTDKCRRAAEAVSCHFLLDTSRSFVDVECYRSTAQCSWKIRASASRL